MTTHASALIGPNPKGSVRRVSLAVRRALQAVRPQDSTLAVACSGGPDSLALLAAAIDQGARLGMPVHSLTVDHRIRPESAAEAASVAALARRLGATDSQVLTALGDSSGSRDGSSLGPEGDAREGRYRALSRACRVLARATGTTVYLLLGHTMDDQAETVLLGLGRGSGMRSIAGMLPLAAPDSPQEPWMMRPLLEVRRNDTVLACKQLGLQAVDDPTNRANGPWRTADGSALRRAAVREFAMPALAGALGQDPAPALMRTATQMRRDNDCLDQAACELLDTVTVTPGVSQYTGRPAYMELDATKLAGLHDALITRILRFAALEAGASADSLSSTHIENLLALVTNYSGQGPIYLPGGIIATRVRLDKPTPRGTPGLTQPTEGAPIRIRFS